MDRQKCFNVAWFLLLVQFFGCSAASENKLVVRGIEPNRVKEIAGVLSEKPIGCGEPISNRQAWERIGELEISKKSILKAEECIKKTPHFGDDIWTDFVKMDGRRDKYNESVYVFFDGFTYVVWAECVENKGRFLPYIEKLISELCAAKTWVHPAHDLKLLSFNGIQHRIDLDAAHFGFELAQTDYLLGDKLSAETRALIRKKVRERIFDVFYEYVYKKDNYDNWWLEGMTNNWAAVCYCGVLGASQILIDDRNERAFFAAVLEHYVMRNYIERGFDNDGLCDEGIGYWDYGFSHFICLSEVLYKATGGKIDLMGNAKVRKIAEFPWRIELLEGVYPSFSDSGYMRKPRPLTVDYVSKKYGFRVGWWKGETEKLASIFRKVIFYFPNSSDISGKKSNERKFGIRDWFESSGMLVCRPAELKKDSMAAVIRGGDNAESHNHDDIGTFVVAVGDRMPLADVGEVEVRTIKTFSDTRYDSKVMNSYGHSVPIVDGKLQRRGKEAKVNVLSHEFTDERDKIVYDLKAAYDVNELLKLQRSFVYSRGCGETLEVIDEVSFNNPRKFGTAIMTMGSCEVNEGTVVVRDGDYGAKVEIEVSGGEYEINIEKISVEAQNANLGLPTRIGINMKKPVKETKIKMTIRGFSKD